MVEKFVLNNKTISDGVIPSELPKLCRMMETDNHIEKLLPLVKR